MSDKTGDAEMEPDGMLAYAKAIQKPDPNDPNWPLPSFDARDWAKEFCEEHPNMDEGLMIAWFANALMRGFDEHARRSVAMTTPSTPAGTAETHELSAYDAGLLNDFGGGNVEWWQDYIRFGLLWRDTNAGQLAIEARKALSAVLTQEEKAGGINEALGRYGDPHEGDVMAANRLPRRQHR